MRNEKIIVKDLLKESRKKNKNSGVRLVYNLVPIKFPVINCKINFQLIIMQ